MDATPVELWARTPEARAQHLATLAPNVVAALVERNVVTDREFITYLQKRKQGHGPTGLHVVIPQRSTSPSEVSPPSILRRVSAYTL